MSQRGAHFDLRPYLNAVELALQTYGAPFRCQATHNKFFIWSSDHSIYRNFLYLEMVRGRPPTTLGARGYGQWNHTAARSRWRWWRRGCWYRFRGEFYSLIPAAPRCDALSRDRAPKYGRIEQSKSDSFSGRRRPKPISTKFSDDHGKNLLCEIRFLDLRTGADRDETNFSSNGNESKWECVR